MERSQPMNCRGHYQMVREGLQNGAGYILTVHAITIFIIKEKLKTSSAMEKLPSCNSPLGATNIAILESLRFE